MSSWPLIINDAQLAKAERLGGDSSPHVLKVSPSTIAKTGSGVYLDEANAMQYVRENTSIPVPAVHRAFVRENGDPCIVMEYVEGQTLDVVWNDLSQPKKEHIISQLLDYMQQLRALTADFIGCVGRRPCHDQIFESDDDKCYGPFNAEADFVDGMIQAIMSRGQNEWSKMVSRFVSALPQNNRIVFTHGDLAPRNILVHGGAIVAIVDWELAGFYPEYWELVKSTFYADFESFWIKDKVLGRILPSYDRELATLLHARDIVW